MGNTLSYYIDSQPIKIDNLLKSLVTDQSTFKVNTNFISCYNSHFLEKDIIAYVNILKPFRCNELDEGYCNPYNIILLYLNDENEINYELITKDEFKNLVINKPNISFGDNNIKYTLIDINTEKISGFKNYEKSKFPLNDYQLYKFIKKHDDNFSILENVYCDNNTFENEQLAFCQICVCTFQESEYIATYQPISLSGEILDEIDIEACDIILLKYYNNGNIEINILDDEKDIEELEKYYINEIIYDEIENKLKYKKTKYLEHLKTIIY